MPSDCQTAPYSFPTRWHCNYPHQRQRDGSSASTTTLAPVRNAHAGTTQMAQIDFNRCQTACRAIPSRSCVPGSSTSTTSSICTKNVQIVCKSPGDQIHVREASFDSMVIYPIRQLETREKFDHMSPKSFEDAFADTLNVEFAMIPSTSHHVFL